jgi:hypothetical protein
VRLRAPNGRRRVKCELPVTREQHESLELLRRSMSALVLPVPAKCARRAVSGLTIWIMANEEIFSYVQPGLFPVLEELRRREPIFHTREFGTTLEDFESALDPHYWEVGASGRRYSRDFVLRALKQNPPVDAVAANWQVSDLGLRRLGSDTYLLTYALNQGERITRRATVWQETPIGWRILYHQGTIVSSEDDDIASHATGRAG